MGGKRGIIIVSNGNEEKIIIIKSKSGTTKKMCAHCLSIACELMFNCLCNIACELWSI